MSDPIKIKPKTQTKCTLHTPGDSEIIDIMPVTQSLGHFWDFNYTLGQHVLYETLRKLYCVCPESQAAGLYSRNKKKYIQDSAENFQKNCKSSQLSLVFECSAGFTCCSFICQSVDCTIF